MSSARLFQIATAILFTFAPALVRAQAPAPLLATAAPPLPDLQSAGPMGQEMFAQSGATGMVLVVVRGHQVFFRGYGETAPNSNQVPTADSLVRLCSLTKIFTTDVLTRLVIDRTVHLDDPLQRFAPARVVVPRRDASIRLVDLATHTSGLSRELGSPPRGTAHFTFPDYHTRWRWLPKQRLRSTPGSAALYSNIAFDLLSDALQSATRTQYAKLLTERTLGPLNMANTTFFPNAAECSRLLIPFGVAGPCTSTEQTAGSSGLYSTPIDMAIWLQYLLGSDAPAIPAQSAAAQAAYIFPSKLVSEEGLDHAGKPTGIGLGWIHLMPTDDPSHIVEKTGGGAGYVTYIAINHARNTALFFAATDGSDNHLGFYTAANQLLTAMAGLPPLPPPPPKPPVRHTRRHRRR